MANGFEIASLYNRRLTPGPLSSIQQVDFNQESFVLLCFLGGKNSVLVKAALCNPCAGYLGVFRL